MAAFVRTLPIRKVRVAVSGLQLRMRMRMRMLLLLLLLLRLRRRLLLLLSRRLQRHMRPRLGAAAMALQAPPASGGPSPLASTLASACSGDVCGGGLVCAGVARGWRMEGRLGAWGG